MTHGNSSPSLKPASEPASEPASSQDRKRALPALLLIAPAPSLGAYVLFLLVPGTTAGYAAYAIGKAWLYGLPVVWYLCVDRGAPGWSRPERGGLLIGLTLGIIIGSVIWVAFLLLRDRIDPEIIQNLVSQNGLATPLRYWAACVWIASINAILEEYAFRWFIFRQCERLMSSGWAVLTAAAIFTAHHVFVLRGYFDWPITLLCCAGVFSGGIIWSWCYLRYRSIWPGYLSHALVDVAIFLVGWQLVFHG